MRHNVLVFPCGSEIGLEIYRSLCYSTHFTLFGGSSVDDHGKFVYDNYIDGIPQVDEPAFVDKINEITKKYDIEFILPAHDSVILELARAREAGKLDAKLITSPLETCEVARSKGKTYEVFNDLLPTPRVYSGVKDVQAKDYPIFLKPDVGQGSKGTHLAKTPEDAGYYTKVDPSLLLLENLPGKEYTVDCFTNRHGELMLSQGRERKRIMNGISVNTEIVEDKRFTEMAEIINRRLKLRGVWFFQVKKNGEGELVLMEIAPRIAGAMTLMRGKGINLVQLSLFDALGYDVRVSGNDYELTVDRALHNVFYSPLRYKHVYLDFDDSVVVDGKVNTRVMAFVYQCLNKGIKVHLLTKHKENLQDSLAKYRLSNIFDDVIHLKKGEEKHLHIKEKEAIFIDDSFAERAKIHDVLHIPVFDTHMVEALVEKGL